jgi:oligoendopeptidase F
MAACGDSDHGLQPPTWDLGGLVFGRGQAAVRELLDEGDRRAQALAAACSGRVARLGSDEFARTIRELAAVRELVARATSYAELQFAADTADPDAAALLQAARERATAIDVQLLFFELEWSRLSDERAEELLSVQGVEIARRHLRSLRRHRPHLLSGPEERILKEKSLTGRASWGRLFAEEIAAIRVDLEQQVGLDEALAQLASPDRGVRRRTARAVTASLAPTLRERAYIVNTIVADKAIDDRLRSYPHWLAERNLTNETSDESVRALVDAVRARYDIPQRWYRIKAGLLGLDRLHDYDRLAPVTREQPHYEWAEARALVVDGYRGFSGRIADVAERFFDERWIDAPVRKNKVGGAFTAATTPAVHPFVLVNFTGGLRDVLTLAHELGHGVHKAFAAPRGIFDQTTPLTVSETASLLGETVVLRRLLDAARDPLRRLALLVESLERGITAVFRQVAMHRFEHLLHTAYRRDGELDAEGINGLWAASQAELLGDSVTLTDGYRTWWSYVPHFVHDIGYLYAYAFGHLLALAMYARYVAEGEAFVPRYVELLEAGGSRPPEELAAIVGMDLADPGLWDTGLDILADQLAEIEEAAIGAGTSV